MTAEGELAPVSSLEEPVTLRLPFGPGLRRDLTGSTSDESVTEAIGDLAGLYEPEVMHALASILKRDSVCFDIGANVGAIALPMESLGPSGCAHVFEPVPQNFGFLNASIEKNGVRNCYAANRSVISRPGKLTSHYVEELAGGSFLTFDVSDPREGLIEVE